MTAKKICYISPLSIHSFRWIEAFHKRGYDVSLITDTSGLIAPRVNFAPVYTLNTLTIRNSPHRLIPNTFQTRRILKKINPDLVNLHVHHFYSPAIFLSGFDYVLTSWGIEVLRLPGGSPIRKGIAKIAGMKAKGIIVDAECLKRIWTKAGVQANKIAVIPFGIDTEIFNPNVKAQMIREKLGIEKGDTVIISTRLFYPTYDVERLIKAIPLVVKDHEDVKFIIKGSGPLERYLKSLARALNVQRYVRFVGLVPYNTIPEHLCAADVYVSTRSDDTTSVSLLEAMACGLAPVVTDIEGNREWITDGVNGFLFPERSTTTLANRIIQLVEKPNLRKQFEKKCLQLVRQNAKWEKCVSKMDAIYKSLI